MFSPSSSIFNKPWRRDSREMPVIHIQSSQGRSSSVFRHSQTSAIRTWSTLSHSEAFRRLCICFVNSVLCCFNFSICFYPLVYNRQIIHLVGPLRQKTESRPSGNQCFLRLIRKSCTDKSQISTSSDAPTLRAFPSTTALLLHYTPVAQPRCKMKRKKPSATPTSRRRHWTITRSTSSRQRGKEKEDDHKESNG
jgi:hypothetical protein